MKSSFIEALEIFLNARDRVLDLHRDKHSSRRERSHAGEYYDEAAHKLEEAHKISLMDLISGDSDAAQ